ncbi:MAG: hypothetical protein WB992_18465 [Bryobacteraceae bacterium]
MNEAIVLPEQDIGVLSLKPPGLDDLLALVGLPSQRRSKGELSPSAEEILKGISSFVDGLLLRAIAAQNQKDFTAVRSVVFEQYAIAVTSFARLIQRMVAGPVIETVLRECFCELEAEFREHGLARFGSAAKDQAMFTVWTLRRTSRIIATIAASGNVAPDLRSQDQEIATKFAVNATWAQFHLDCLLVGIRHDKSIQLQVLPEIIDGLRAAVNAYGYARQGLNFRSPQEEVTIQPFEWDEEDQELLDSSMKDMDTATLLDA